MVWCKLNRIWYIIKIDNFCSFNIWLSYYNTFIVWRYSKTKEEIYGRINILRLKVEYLYTHITSGTLSDINSAFYKSNFNCILLKKLSLKLIPELDRCHGQALTVIVIHYNLNRLSLHWCESSCTIYCLHIKNGNVILPPFFREHKVTWYKSFNWYINLIY